MKDMFKFWLEFIAFMVGVLISIAIALLPSFVYAYYGGENKDIDILLRCIGYIGWLGLVVWYFNPKKPQPLSKKELDDLDKE